MDIKKFELLDDDALEMVSGGAGAGENKPNQCPQGTEKSSFQNGDVSKCSRCHYASNVGRPTDFGGEEQYYCKIYRVYTPWIPYEFVD